MSRTLVLATRNVHKVGELMTVLSAVPVTVVGLEAYPNFADVEETGTTFAENAALKARAAARHTGEWALADDSGLEVDALSGAPGVRSSRFAGEHATDARNNEKLLRLLATVPRAQRTARFRCAIAISTPDGTTWIDEGTCEGIIAESPRGEGGFGYDPLFIVPEMDRTFAELPPETKERISHRARALARARDRLSALLAAR